MARLVKGIFAFLFLIVFSASAFALLDRDAAWSSNNQQTTNPIIFGDTINFWVYAQTSNPPLVAKIELKNQDGQTVSTILPQQTVPNPYNPADFSLTSTDYPSNGRFYVVFTVQDEQDLFTEILTLDVMKKDPYLASNVPAIAFNEDTSFQIDLDNYFNDDESYDTLTFSYALSNPERVTITQDPSDASKFTLTNKIANFNGNAGTIRFFATDGASAWIPSNEVSITVNPVNDAPVITSTALTTATEDQPYSYDADATDVDGNTLVYSLTQKPSDMSINSNNGIIQWTPTNADVGAHSVTVRVTDGNGGSATQSYTLTVVNVNDAPYFVTSPLLSATQGQLYSYTAEVQDIDPTNDVLTYTLIANAAGMTIAKLDNNHAKIEWTPTNAQALAGSADVTLRVDDGKGGIDTQSYTITVQNVNDAPVLTSTAVTSATQDVLYQYDVEATDADGNTLVYSLTQKPSSMSINSNNGLIQWTPTNADVGPHSITVRVEDGNGGVSTQSFTLTVQNKNDAPQITSTPPTAATQDVLYQYDVNAADSDGDTLIFSLTRAPDGMSINGNSGLISWTPTNAQALAGTASVTVKVSDGKGGEDTQSYTITITNVNDAPSFVSVPITGATQDTLYSYDSNAVDPDGDAITYSLIQAPAGMTINTISGLVQWTPTQANLGNHAVKIRATDVNGAFSEQPYTLTVFDINDAPHITSSPGTSATQGVQYAYDAEATDPDGDTLTFSLTQAPAGMVINSNSGLIVWVPSNAQALAGSASVTVKAEDGRGGAATQSFTISITNVNDNPVITSSPITSATQDVLYQYDVEATDPDGDALTYSLQTAPSGMSINSNNGLIQWTPTNAQIGAHGVTVRVIDNKGGSATQSFTLTVQNQNDAPQITSTPITSATQGVLYQYDVNAVDADGDTLAFSLTQAPAGMSINSNSGLVAWVPSNAQALAGSASVTVNVADGRGGTDAQSFTIYVANVNDAPYFTSSPVTGATQGVLYQYDADAVDPDGDSISYSLPQAPGGMSIDSNNGLIQWVPGNGQVGSNAVTVRATDSNGAIADQSFAIQVSDVNDAPSANSFSISTSEDTPVSFSLSCSDPDGNALNYIVLSGPSQGSLSGSGVSRIYSPNPNYNGGDSLNYKCNDGGYDSNTATVSISVGPVNDAPQITSYSPSNLNPSMQEGQTLPFSVTASDPDGNALSYTWRLDGGVVSTATTASYTAAFNSAGTHTMVVTVSDGSSAVSVTWTITVGDVNLGPVLAPIGNKFIPENELLEFNISAVDSDNDPLTYRVTGLPQGATFSPQLTFQWIPAFGQAGAYDVLFEVEDTKGGKDSEQITITVGIGDRPPESIQNPQEKILIDNMDFINGFDVRPGEDLLLALTFTNNDPFEMDDARVMVAIRELGIRNLLKPFDVNSGETTHRNYLLTIPEDAPAGEYTAVVTISDGKSTRIKHRPIRVNP